MNKILTVLLLLAIGFLSCNDSEKKIDKIDIAKHYLKTLDTLESSKISNWLGDSIKTIEGEHKNTYSKNAYLEILKWDAVFGPNYEILNLEEKNGMVNVKLSKTDKRINFLHEKPFIINQIITFEKDKISSIQTDYLNFDVPTWEKNKKDLLDSIDKSHPDLNGFINDLTENGGLKFLKAIQLYENKKQHTNKR